MSRRVGAGQVTKAQEGAPLEGGAPVQCWLPRSGFGGVVRSPSLKYNFITANGTDLLRAPPKMTLRCRAARSEGVFQTPPIWRCSPNTSGGVLRRHEGDPPMGALPPPPLLLPLLSFPLLPPPLPSHRLLLHFAGLLSLPSLEILPLYGGRSLSSYSHNPSPSGPPSRQQVF